MIRTQSHSNNLYALIIGINDYPSPYVSLYDAVTDAHGFRDFLSYNLKVPDDHLRVMLNSKRCDLISTFSELRDGRLRIRDGNSIQIPRGSAFIFYYSGHGGRTEIPKEWREYRTADGQVEQLVPSDIGQRSPDSNHVIQGIPDRTIAAVLKGLIRRIGDNVTVIFDCCHSAGQTRAPGSDVVGAPLRLRYLSDLPPLSGDCDDDIRGKERSEVGMSRATRGGMSSSHRGSTFAEPDENSYILLAACQQEQYAAERNGGGVFTTKLLQILNSESLESLTYAGIMLRMVMPDQLQTPACFGANQHRVIFTTKEFAKFEDCFIGEICPSYGQSDDTDSFTADVLVYGGLAHGIREGSRFLLHDITPQMDQIGEGVVSEIFSTCSLLSVTWNTSKHEHGTRLYCRLAREYGTFTVFCDSSDQTLFSNINAGGYSFGRASNHDEAMVIIKDEKRRPQYVQLFFGNGGNGKDKIFDDNIGNRFMTSIPKMEASKIRDSMVAMLCIRSLLEVPKNIPQGWEGIEIKFLKVEKAIHEAIRSTDIIEHSWYHRIGAFSHSLYDKGDVVTVNVRKRSQLFVEREHFGMSIENNTTEYLFAYVLCVEPGELRVYPWYSSTYFTPDIPFYERDGSEQAAGGIKPNETLCIGHGNSAVDPLRFVIADELTEDRIYLKIILTTSPADFSMLTRTNNPTETPSAPSSSMVRSSTARYLASEEDVARVLGYIDNQPRIASETVDFYSVTLTVRQLPVGRA